MNTVIFWKPELVIRAMPTGLTVTVKVAASPSEQVAARHAEDRRLSAAA
jgi:hypothetical protein